MSNETSKTSVTRLIPPIAIIALLIMIASAIFHVATMTPPAAPAFDRSNAPTAPDYSEELSWFSRPTGERPAGWDTPWGIDIVWFVDRPEAFMGGWNIPLDWAAVSATYENDQWLTSESDDLFDVFAPKRRFLSSLTGHEVDIEDAMALEQEDMLASVDFYLSEDNQMRGIFLGGSGDGVAAAYEAFQLRLDATLPYNTLFGGFIITDQPADKPTPLDMPPCGSDSIYPCVLDLSALSDDERLTAVDLLMTDFSDYLAENVPKPAAPLPPFETIELSPINRPEHELE